MFASTNYQPEAWTLPISRWSIWQMSDLDNSSPNVDFIDANARRKLSKFAKMGLKVAHDCTDNVPQARFVFASQHGDLKRATDMLFNLALNEELSPTTFSMSVLNACAGMYSIAKQDRSPSIAISAGASSFGYGLLEAALQYANTPETPVIYVYVDEVPPIVCAVNESPLSNSHAVGLLISNDATVQMRCAISDTLHVPHAETQSESFMHSLLNKKNHAWDDGEKRWGWIYSERQN